MLKKVIKKELGIRKKFPQTAKTRGKFLSSVFFYVVSFSARNSEYVFTFLIVRWRLLVRLPSPNKNKLHFLLLLSMSQKFISLLYERARAQEEEPLQKSFDLNAVEVVVHQ